MPMPGQGAIPDRTLQRAYGPRKQKRPRSGPFLFFNETLSRQLASPSMIAFRVALGRMTAVVFAASGW